MAMQANSCGHEWVVELTCQEDESHLDSALIDVLGDLLSVDNFAIYINKHVTLQAPPILINTHSNLTYLEPNQAQLILNKATPSKTRVVHTTDDVTTYIPVNHSDTILGVLIIKTKQLITDRISALAMYILNVYANQLWILHKSRLDPLTGLLNRQTFDKKVMEIVTGNGFLLPREQADTKRCWYLAIIDIDLFKNVNDTFGHVVGDGVIAQVAKLIKNNFRIEDYAFRYGGEEFAIVFQSQTNTDALNALSRLRQRVASHDFEHIQQLTISIGFLELQSADTVSSIVNQADIALYHSKKTGRNKVTSCHELTLSKEVRISQ